MKKDIYIIKNTVNDKCYIGQSVDYKTRFRKHCEVAKRNNFKYKSYLYNAMNELGIEHFYVELLESQVENYNERERFYIKEFNTLRPNGYNLAAGGDWYPHLNSVEHHNAKITNLEELETIYDELQYSTYTLTEIANMHNVSFSVIQNINSGDTYYNSNLIYPLKQCILTKSQLDRLTYDLKYSNYTYVQLSKIYNISVNQVKAINSGTSWHRDYIDYPLRQMVFSGKNEIIEQIQKDLLSTNINFADLAKKYNCSKNTIQRINSGETHRNSKLLYPLRREKICTEDIINIHDLLLKSKKSIHEIAMFYKVSEATIKRINSGKTKKYILNNYNYPLR